ncbi:hypothetical protein F0L74_09870 [Chitinophaga agrisoli]|uniref:Uncharacterized protein n=1 Tax=Chitinophaga agrisoli TaxID=2607653 RepID=A0A5B2VX97_9BACT|nr:hypothetical protein [Chitinophaga agrisoli]KAA2242826.1 hypothetical protein F0L74_09870 [Chitinophaga agrisoli]
MKQILFVLPLFLASCSIKPKEVSQMSTEAFTIAKVFVKAKLATPATADFPHVPDRVDYLGDSLFRIVSYVDAQNRMGATIRTSYGATVHYKGGDWSNVNNWELLNFSSK